MFHGTHVATANLKQSVKDRQTGDSALLRWHHKKYISKVAYLKLRTNCGGQDVPLSSSPFSSMASTQSSSMQTKLLNILCALILGGILILVELALHQVR